ncbi:MAG: 30S ribosomal protein S16 [Candidatus Curtissbacteria bacterium]|nr:30S ribosomal protein S16 [Candidatus Curtissbacteria bacterium]
MSVKIRLSRTGKSHQVSYRIVAQDTRGKRDGKFLEILGFYNPYNKPALEINREKLASWTKNGAKPTLAVASLLKSGGLTKKVSKRKLARDKAKEEKTDAAIQPEEPKVAEEPKADESKPSEDIAIVQEKPKDEPPAEATQS